MRQSTTTINGNPRRARGNSNSSFNKSDFRDSYVFGSAAPAIEPDFSPKKKQGTDDLSSKKKKRSFKVISFGKPKEATQPSLLSSGVKLFCSLVIMFAIVGVISITFSSMSVALSVEQQSLQSQISQAREDGKALEVQYGTLSTPSHVKEKAYALGMTTAKDSLQINLNDSNVKVDEEGNLSLASTINAISGE